VRVKPLATRKSRPPSVMPLKTALRNTFFLPKVSSRPCGHVAKINHSAAATAIRMANAHSGWRSMNFVMSAARGLSAPGRGRPGLDDGLKHSTPCRPLSSPGATVVHRPHPPPSYRSVRPGLDRQYPFARSPARSGPQDLGGTPIVRWRHADIGGEEVRESALRRKAEIEADVGDRRFGGHQRVQRSFHQQRVDVEVRRDAGLGAKKLVEMRTRKPCLARDRIELDLGADALRQQLDRLAHAKVGDRGAGTTVPRGVRVAPALFVASVDQAAQLSVETLERGSAANHRRGLPDIPVQCRGALECRASETQTTDASEPLGVDVENKEKRSVRQIFRQEIVRLPGIDRDDGIFAQRARLLEHFNAARRAANLVNQMPFAVRVHVEWTIELIHRRAAEMAVKDSKSPAHAFLPRIVPHCFL